MFEEKTKSQITLNMPSNLVASKVAIWANIIMSMKKFSLLLRPVATELESLLPYQPNSRIHLLLTGTMHSVLSLYLYIYRQIDIPSPFPKFDWPPQLHLWHCCPAYVNFTPISYKWHDKILVYVTLVLFQCQQLLGYANARSTRLIAAHYCQSN